MIEIHVNGKAYDFEAVVERMTECDKELERKEKHMYLPLLKECAHCRRPIIVEINFVTENEQWAQSLVDRRVFVQSPTCSDCFHKTMENVNRNLDASFFQESIEKAIEARDKWQAERASKQVVASLKGLLHSAGMVEVASEKGTQTFPPEFVGVQKFGHSVEEALEQRRATAKQNFQESLCNATQKERDEIYRWLHDAFMCRI